MNRTRHNVDVMNTVMKIITDLPSKPEVDDAICFVSDSIDAGQLKRKVENRWQLQVVRSKRKQDDFTG